MKKAHGFFTRLVAACCVAMLPVTLAACSGDASPSDAATAAFSTRRPTVTHDSLDKAQVPSVRDDSPHAKAVRAVESMSVEERVGQLVMAPLFAGSDPSSLYDLIATLSEMARIYGKSNVTIYGGTFYQNIYGGGDMAVVENIKKYGNKIIRKDATNVIIGDKANILGSVFAGGKGRKRRLTTPNATTVSTDGFTQLPDSVGKVIGNTNVTFTGSSQQALISTFEILSFLVRGSLRFS